MFIEEDIVPGDYLAEARKLHEVLVDDHEAGSAFRHLPAKGLIRAGREEHGKRVFVDPPPVACVRSAKTEPCKSIHDRFTRGHQMFDERHIPFLLRVQPVKMHDGDLE